WQQERIGTQCILNGPYLYVTRSSSPAFEQMRAAMNDTAATVHYYIRRLNTKSGAKEWEYYHAGPPQNFQPKEKRLLLQFSKEVQVLKFL
ncbi:MAG: hypothetical protein AB1813_29540, partial [Verrucomicrobiota bacterium]